MPAYALFIREGKIQDQAAMDAYRSTNRGGTERFGLRPLVVYGKTEAVEGHAPDGLVVLEFPTLEEAKAWYFSPAYQQASEFRKKAAEYRVFFVEGFSPPG